MFQPRGQNNRTLKVCNLIVEQLKPIRVKVKAVLVQTINDKDMVRRFASKQTRQGRACQIRERFFVLLFQNIKSLNRIGIHTKDSQRVSDLLTNCRDSLPFRPLS